MSMPPILRALSSVGLCAGLLGLSLTALGDDKQEAEKHFDAGTELMKVEDFDGALAEFEASVEIFPSRAALFNLGNCLKAMHRYGEALDAFERLEQEFGDRLDEEMKQALARQREEIHSVIAELSVRADRADATIAIDGEKVGTTPIDKPFILGPGKHEIAVSLDGFETAVDEVKLVAGQHEVLMFKLVRAHAVLVINTDVSGAEVFVDGAREGETPLVDPIPLTEGEHFVRVSREGYEEIEREISVEPGEKLTLDFGLRRIGGAGGSVDGGPRPSPLFWVGFSTTLVCGLAAGALWIAASVEYEEFKIDRADYNELKNPDSLSYDPVEADVEYRALSQVADVIERRGRMALGFGIGAGALAVATTIILIVDLKKGDPEEPHEVAFTVVPNGLVIAF
jgi:tetratricopeptide (TPR) repeat protein